MIDGAVWELGVGWFFFFYDVDDTLRGLAACFERGLSGRKDGVGLGGSGGGRRKRRLESRAMGLLAEVSPRQASYYSH